MPASQPSLSTSALRERSGPTVTTDLIERAKDAVDLTPETRADRLLRFMRTTIDSDPLPIPMLAHDVWPAALAHSESTAIRELDRLLQHLEEQGWVVLPTIDKIVYEPTITVTETTASQPYPMRTDRQSGSAQHEHRGGTASRLSQVGWLTGTESARQRQRNSDTASGVLLQHGRVRRSDLHHRRTACNLAPPFERDYDLAQCRPWVNVGRSDWWGRWTRRCVTSNLAHPETTVHSGPVLCTSMQDALPQAPTLAASSHR